jgi:hypothetical protein
MLSISAVNSCVLPFRRRMRSKVSAISARPATRPEGVTREIVPSITAPSNSDGLRVVMVKRSSAFEVRVVSALSSVPTIRVPSGTPRSSAPE